MNTCATCRFYEAIEPAASPHGLCRRHPPQPVDHAKTGALQFVFPLTQPQEWCGEWAAQPEPGPQLCEAWPTASEVDAAAEKRARSRGR